MQPTTNLAQVYKDLADGYEKRGQAQMRDRFLVLAADAALAAGHADEAERFRQRLLTLNPHHMLKPYANFSQARQAPDVDTYVRNLRLNYPQDVAEDLRRTLQIGTEPIAQTMAPPPAPAAPPSVEQSFISHMGPGVEGSIAWHLPPEDEPVVERTAALPAGVNPIRALMQAAAQEQAAAKPRQQPPAPRPIVPDSSKLDQTAPLPAGLGRMPAPRPIAGDTSGADQTAALPPSGLGRFQPPSRAENDKTEASPRSGPRVGPAPTPRSAAPPPRPVPAVPTPRPAPPTRSPAPFGFDSGSSGKVPVVGPRPGSHPHSAGPQEEAPEGYDWLASALFVLVALLGLAVVGYTLARPFLQ